MIDFTSISNSCLLGESRWTGRMVFGKIVQQYFACDSETVLKSGRGCNILPHPSHPLPPPPPRFTARHCIYFDRGREGQRYRYIVYIDSLSTLKPDFSCISKKSVLRFVIVVLYLLFKYYRGFLD